MLELPGDTVSQLEALGSGDNKGTRLANLFAVFARWMNGLPHDSGDSAESAPARVLAPRDPRSRSARSAG